MKCVDALAMPHLTLSADSRHSGALTLIMLARAARARRWTAHVQQRGIASLNTGECVDYLCNNRKITSGMNKQIGGNGAANLRRKEMNG